MKTLNMTLKKEWFDMILSGEKKEEYREIKPYWWKRLVQCGEWDQRKIIMNKHYDNITFRNGYAKNAPTIKIEYVGVKIGKPISGLAEEGWLDTDVFVISLGKILETQNINK